MRYFSNQQDNTLNLNFIPFADMNNDGLTDPCIMYFPKPFVIVGHGVTDGVTFPYLGTIPTEGLLLNLGSSNQSVFPFINLFLNMLNASLYGQNGSGIMTYAGDYLGHLKHFSLLGDPINISRIHKAIMPSAMVQNYWKSEYARNVANVLNEIETHIRFIDFISKLSLITDEQLLLPPGTYTMGGATSSEDNDAYRTALANNANGADPDYMHLLVLELDNYE